MIKCKDFVSKIFTKGGFFTPVKAQKFKTCHDHTNQWISKDNIQSLNIENPFTHNFHISKENALTSTVLKTYPYFRRKKI